MSRPTAVFLTVVIGGSVLGCAHTGPKKTFVVQPYPTPTFTKQPVTSTGTDVAPSVKPSPTRRASRSRALPGAAEWAATPTARAVAFCESGRDNSARSHTGKYRGKWQMDADFWATYGGLRYASSPDLATEAEQDTIAYRGWLARGWQPWTCARIVGAA